MISIGETLRGERQRRGLSLLDVTAETRINPRMLAAIEANQFDRLPAGLLARSFVRQYARMMALDEEEVLTALRGQIEDVARPPLERPAVDLSVHSPCAPRVPPLEPALSRLRTKSMLWAVAWLAVMMLAWARVDSLWHKDEPKPANKPTVIAARKPAPSADPVNLAHSSEVENPSTPVAVRAAFTAREPVWVSIKSDGIVTYTGMLEVQQTRQSDASSEMIVLIGNAGGLEISLNGKPIGPMGEHGQVRLVQLTPQGAHVLPRSSPVQGEDPPRANSY